MIIVVDANEREPWRFRPYGYPVLTKRLRVGDVSLAGYEHEIAIERKSDVRDLVKFLTSREFERKVELMSKCKCAYLICEFPKLDIDKYPAKSSLPKKDYYKAKSFPHYLLSDVQTKYGIIVLYPASRENA